MKKLFLLLISIFAYCTLSAQVTTAGMNGTVTDEAGEPLVGATVIAVHTPSGTQYGAITNQDGRYHMQGMRTGGPYTVTMSYVGYQAVEFTGINLKLGESETRDAFLKSSTELEAIVVVSTAANRFNSNKTGAAQNFNSEAIAAVPTINRSIADIAALNPQSIVNKGGGTSFGGANNRYNSFQIDGIVSNDVFGLASSGTNGGQAGANPISLDAIEEIQVVVAPFDVRQSGFTGGGINAITKSGTNQFKGSAYTYYNDEGFYGTTPGKNVGHRTSLNDQSTKVFGATLGGPIVKDKLFFFLSGEYNKESYPATYYVDKTGSITTDQLKQIAKQYKELTGLEAGSYGIRDVDTKSGSLLARIDWNINRDHKLTLRYNFLDASDDKYSTKADKFYYGNASYLQSNRTHSLVAELNSRLSDNLSNELRVGYTRVRDFRDPDSYGPNVQITVANPVGETKKQNNTIYLGTEYSSGANRLNQDVYTITDNFTWYKGTHTMTFGTHNEIYSIYNLFIQNCTGSWTYNSLDDFMDNRPNTYVYKFSDEELTGSKLWGAAFRAGQFGFYAQDEWKPNRNFSLTYGLRIDIPVMFDKPRENKEFNQSEYAQKFGVRVGQVPTTKVLWSPRIGFRWFTDESHNTLFRGGLGLFTGRVPFVWMANNFSNTGVELLTSKGGPMESVAAPHLTPDHAKNPPVVGKAGVGVQDINVIDKKFKYPQVFRANLAWEQNLGRGYNLTVEALYTKTVNNVMYRNLMAEDNGKKVYAVSEEAANEHNTTVYYDRRNMDKYNYIIELGNTSKGYSYSLTAKLEKTFDFGLYASAAYTFGHSKSVTDATSSVAYSSYGYNYALEQNNPELATSLFDIPHRIIAQVTYSKRYAKYFGSTISLVYNAYSGQPYSYYFYSKGDAIFNNNGFNAGNTLGYIPTDAELDQMTWKSDADKQNFREFIMDNKYLRNHRGQFSKRNGLRNPFEHHLDLHFAQDFYFGKLTNRKVQITLDILNFTNMLCRSWGTYYGNYYGTTPLTVVKVTEDAKGNMTPTYSFYQPKNDPSDILSRWHMQLGVRVVF